MVERCVVSVTVHDIAVAMSLHHKTKTKKVRGAEECDELGAFINIRHYARGDFLLSTLGHSPQLRALELGAE